MSTHKLPASEDDNSNISFADSRSTLSRAREITREIRSVGGAKSYSSGYGSGSGSYSSSGSDAGSGSYTPSPELYARQWELHDSRVIESLTFSGAGGRTPISSRETGYGICPSSNLSDLTTPTPWL